MGRKISGLLLGLVLGWSMGDTAMAGGSIEGQWQSRGWALMVDISATQVDLYQYTESSLLPLGGLMREGDSIRLDARTRLTFERIGEALRVSDGEGTVRIDFEAIASLPATTAFSTDPVANFDLFSALFAENYALFDINMVDWTAATAQARSGISGSTSNAVLFDTLTSLLAPLNDRHTSLSDGSRFYQSGPAKDRFWEDRRDEMLANIAASRVDNGVLAMAGGDSRVRFGTFDAGRILYVAVLDLAADPGGRRLADALDTALGRFPGFDALVVDLRFNGGGREANGLDLLDRLTDSQRVAFARETRSTLDGGFTPAETILTAPAGDNPGLLPIAILTSNETASSAEKVALGAAYLPWATLVGVASKGILSSTLDLVLANGWTLGLSHQRTYSVAGEFFEQLGVPPDIEVTMNADNVAAGDDPMLNAALAHLVGQPRITGTRQSVDGTMSGIWFDARHSGEGWIIEVLPDARAFVTWFSYPPSGSADRQAWMTAVGRIDDNRIVLDEVQRTGGASFGDAFDPADVVREPWGRIEFAFETCDSGYLVYEGPAGFRSGVQRLDRLAGIDGLPCGQPNAAVDPAGAARFTGSWFDPQRAGEGWMLSVIDPETAFVAWFTYDEQDRQAWMVGNGRIEEDVIAFDELVYPAGGVFGPAFDADAVERPLWGSLRFEFADCDTLRVDYVSTLDEFGAGSRDAVRLTTPVGIACE